MKILIVANKMPYPAKDGGTIATLTLACSLQKCGCNVDLLAMNTPKHFCRIENIPQSLKDKINFHAVEVDTTIKPAKALKNLLFSNLPYNAERFISDDFSQKLISLLKNGNYDIVQLEGLYLCPYIKLIRQFSNAKISLRAHNIEHEIWLRMVANETNILKKTYKKSLANRIRQMELSYINSYDFLVPITTRDADFFNEKGNTKPIFVAQTGIEPENPMLSLENSEADFPGFFHLGALDWYPNCEGLTWFVENVWREYKSKHREAKFSVAGRNADKSFAKFLIDNGVDYVGEVESASEFYAKNSVFIVPLFSGSGMRIKIVEGMAAAKTIITTPIGTEGIATTHKTDILIANSATEFLSLMEEISTDKQLHDEISQNARNFIKQNYDNQKIAEGLVVFYER